MSLAKLTHKKFVLLFALLCFISILALGFHHHHDQGLHFDCPTCVSGNLFSTGITTDSAFIVFLAKIIYRNQSDAFAYPFLSLLPTNADRAPPLPLMA